MLLIIQIIISIIVVYLIFSVIVYVIVEWIAGFLQLRGRNLQKAICNLFDDPGNKKFGELIYKHPQVATLMLNDKRLTPYIPARNVSAALIDLVGAGPASASTVEKIREPYALYLEGLRQLNDGPLKTLLISIGQPADNLATLTASFEKWYNDYMDRVTGWYKKKIRLVVLVVSLLVTLGFNVDTIYILQTAKNDPATRQRLNTLADKLIADSGFNRTVSAIPVSPDNYFEDYVNDSSVHAGDAAALHESTPFAPDSAQALRRRQLQELTTLVREENLPVGWGIKKSSLLLEILGWLLSTLALSAGAPFWFDMLKKLVNVRTAGPKPDGAATKTS